MSGILYEGEPDVRVQQLAAHLVDLRPFWPRVVPLFVMWMRRQFETEGEFGGDRWEPLTEEYATRKAARWGSKGILYASGDLRMAASLPRREVGPRTLVLEIDDSDKAHGGKEPRSVVQYHQDGTNTMPARPLLFGDPLPPEPAEQLEAAVREYADELVARLGFV